jgi:SAM-dependent methyltransferase
VGVDPDAGMLTVAAREAPGIEWRVGTAEALPLDDGSQDAVVSQFGMMFFRDRDRAAAEMLRVLAERGRLAVAVWDALERSPAYSTLVALLEDLAGSDAAEALRAPFTLGDAHDFALPFRRAGLDEMKLVTRSGTARFPDVRTMVEADLRGWLPVMGVVLDDERIEEILAAAEHALAGFVDAQGRVIFPSSAHILSGLKG